MKNLIMSSILFLGSLSAHAANVNVVVDGKAYNCTQGGGSSCSCRVTDDRYYFVQLEGIDIARNGSYNSKGDALIACKSRIKELDVCN